MNANVAAKVTADAIASLFLIILIIRAYVTAVLFSGGIGILLTVGFTSSFYGTLLVTAFYESMRIEVIIYFYIS